jgi:thiol-disulfide isomerase/thioredoxin
MQASTGMTTGSWFVLFKAEQCGHCARIRPIFDQLGDDEEIAEKGIVLATIDAPSNRKTAARFHITGFPVMLFLHRGQIYRFKGRRTFENLKKFVVEDVHSMLGGPIPPPLSSLEVMLRELASAAQDFYDAASGRGGTVGMALTVLMVMFILLIVILVAMCFWPSTRSEHDKMD